MTENKRKRELELGPVGPWGARITVAAVETNHGRRSIVPQDHIFEVVATWVGPPPVLSPASSRPVQAMDTVAVDSLEHAKVVAHKAADYFRAPDNGQPPDLRELAGIL